MRVQVGVQLFLMGCFKKMAIADRMAVFCDPIFKNPEQYSTGACWVAVLAYALRIYCDFSGYSDMALGLAHLFGYRLTNNFNMPYISQNVTEFWRRWHISLSTWLRDYVFIPLGGSRGGRWATYRNLMIVMAVGGLWHGAAWGYVLWGLAHGLMLVLNKQFKDYCEIHPRLDAAMQSGIGTALRIAFTFFCVSMCWVLFQPEFAKALAMYKQLFALHGGLALPLSNPASGTPFSWPSATCLCAPGVEVALRRCPRRCPIHAVCLARDASPDTGTTLSLPVLTSEPRRGSHSPITRSARVADGGDDLPRRAATAHQAAIRARGNWRGRVRCDPPPRGPRDRLRVLALPPRPCLFG